jgi:chromosomal replication initiation ATPase DnaA
MTHEQEKHAERMRMAARIQKERKDLSNINLPAKVRRVVMFAASEHRVTLGQVLGSSKSTPIMRARRQAAQSLRAMGFSFSQIGRYLGKHHTTIQYACAMPAETGPDYDRTPIPVPDLSGEWAI